MRLETYQKDEQSLHHHIAQIRSNRESWLSKCKKLPPLRPVDTPWSDINLAKTSPKVAIWPLENPSAKIALIGDYPSKHDKDHNAFFVHGIGNLLDQIMEKTGLSRSDVYLTNIFKYYKRAHTLPDLAKVKPKYSNELLENCKLLEEELKEFDLLVPLGNLAMWVICGTKNIIKYNGSILATRPEFGNKKAIPSIHPREAMRKYMFRNYMIPAFQRISDNEEADNDFNIKLYPSLQEVKKYLKSLKPSQPVAFDIETCGFEVTQIGFAHHKKKSFVISFLNKDGNVYDLQTELEIWKHIKRFLENETYTKIAHNAMFDVQFLLKKYGILTKNIEDTMVMQAICYPDYPKGLDMTTMLYTRIPYFKEDGKQHKNVRDWDEFSLYNGKDTIACLQAFKPLKEDLEVYGLTPTYRRQMSIFNSVLYFQMRGLRADTKKIWSLKVKSQGKLVNYERALQEIGIKNPKSSKQVMEHFYVKLKAKSIDNPKTGKPSSDEKALKKLASRGYEDAVLLLKHRKEAKFLSSYLNAKLSQDDRFMASYNIVGTKQGRLSSSKTLWGIGLNLQTLPYRMKEAVIADRNCILCEIDYSQAENRIVAYVANEPKMIQAFESGQDVHSLTAGLLFDKPVEEVSKEKDSSPFRKGKSERDEGKLSNHSLNYAIGPRTFSENNQITFADAKMIIDKYFKGYPNVKKFHKWLVDDLEFQGMSLLNCFGRRRVYQDRPGSTMHKEAYSFIPQSTVADMINERALSFIYNHPELQDVEIVNQVHDSVILQFNKNLGTNKIINALKIIQDEMTKPIKWKDREFSIPTDCCLGYRLSQLKEINVYGEDAREELEQIMDE